MKKLLPTLSCAVLMTSTVASGAQLPKRNYDEAKVPAYTLPDPLVCADGRKVTDVETWEQKRRPELLQLFADQIYGHAPQPGRGRAKFEVTSIATNALDGKATRKEITIWLTGAAKGPSMNLLLYLPNRAKQPAPAFLGMNAGGNHAIMGDPGIHLSDRWVAGRFSGVVSSGIRSSAMTLCTSICIACMSSPKRKMLNR